LVKSSPFKKVFARRKSSFIRRVWFPEALPCNLPILFFSPLHALARLGYALEEPKIAAAMEYLLSRQLPDGSCPLDKVWPRSASDFGKPGKSNKWLTLDVLRAVKLLYPKLDFRRFFC